MNLFVVAVLAEHDKQRRTLARAIAFAAPFMALVLSLFVLGNLEAMARAAQVAPWQAYVDSLLRIWAVFLLPVMATLQAVLLAQLEHGNRQWKFLLTLPLRREWLYLAKAVNLGWLVVLAHGALWVMGAVACIVMAGGVAEGGGWRMLGDLAVGLAATCVASWVLAAVQLLVSVALESFVAAISIGLVATLASLVAAPVLGNVALVVPWAIPGQALAHPSPVWWLLWGLAVLGLLGMGARRMRGREVH